MPAAAVIPAPIAYIKVVAVKKLVVGFLLGEPGPVLNGESSVTQASTRKLDLCLIAWCGVRVIYFEEIRVFIASNCIEYISMG